MNKPNCYYSQKVSRFVYECKAPRELAERCPHYAKFFDWDRCLERFNISKIEKDLKETETIE